MFSLFIYVFLPVVCSSISYQGQPFVFAFTVFMSNEIKLHPTDTVKVNTFLGWREASNDIAIAGLGWVSITGPGICKVKATVPQNTSVTVRSPLLPFEASHTTARFTGGKLLKKSKKGGDGQGYGWRAQLSGWLLL